MGERKVPGGTAIVMITVAVGIDLISIASDFFTVGLMGWIFDAITTIIFSFWLSRYDVKLWSPEHWLGSAASFIVDALPFGDFTFPWAWRIGKLVLTERKPAAVQKEAPQKKKAFGWVPERVAANDNTPSLDKVA